MRRLSEGAVSATESGDRLWHARAIEGLLLCMTLQAWQGKDFIVPELFDPSKAFAASQASSRSRSLSISARITAIAQRADVSKLRPFERWFQLAPFVARLTLDLYESLQAQDSPTITIVESKLRLINILVFCQTSQGNVDLLDAFVLHQTQPLPRPIPSIPRVSDYNLTNMLADLVASADTIGDITGTVQVLIAIIGMLAALGADRKRTFSYRSLLNQLAPALIKARKIGASEAGIHPQTALAATSSTSDGYEGVGGLQSLLKTVAFAARLSVPSRDEIVPINTVEQLPGNLASWTRQHSDGDLSLRLEMLQACVAVCDAMPDMQSSLSFTSELLRLAILSPTLSTAATESRPWLTPEDQTKHVDSVKRVSAAAHRLGLDKSRATYWNDFLVRDIQIYQLPHASELSSHQPSKLAVVHDDTVTGPREPFIFNPFARTASANAAPIVVAGELVTFSVLLQNPLELDIDVDKICLVTEGCDFEPTHHSMILGSFCSQIFTMTGIARSKGLLKVNGCRATVAGCYEQVFPVYRAQWRPPTRVKLRSKHNEEGIVDDLNIPQPSTVTLRVIDPQPEVQLGSVDLTQTSLMLLEGEKKTFKLAIKNTSSTVAADLVLFAFQDNVSAGLHEAASRKDLAPVDLYEVQHQLKTKPTIRTINAADNDNVVSPKQTIKREFELSGRPGLLNAAVQVNFAYLGVPRREIKETFYTRSARVPLAVTVNGSIEILRCNILPINDDFTFTSPTNTNSAPPTTPDGHCMLSFDLRNVWPSPLNVHLASHTSLTDSSSPYTFTDTIQPGAISRCILLIPRLFVADAYAPVPSLVTQRQYVISASKLSLEAEAASREAFWYREELLKHLSATWKEEKTDRHGETDLRKGVRLTPRMIDVLKVEHVGIQFEVVADAETPVDAVKKLGRSHYQVPSESFGMLRVTVRNRSKDKLALLLRLQISLRDQPHNIALDLTRRFAYSGLLQQAMPKLETGEERVAKLGIVPLIEGKYEINATVEEIRGRRRAEKAAGDGMVGSGPERRIWHARGPCWVDAVTSLRRNS